jgi:hypothetical protein
MIDLNGRLNSKPHLIAVPSALFTGVLGTDMKKVDVFQFYTLATILKPLQTLQQDAPLKDAYYQLYHAKIWLEGLAEDKMVPLVVSRASIWKLLNAINAIVEPPLHHLQQTEPPKAVDMEKKLEFMECYEVRNAVNNFETVFSAELQTLATYFVSKKLAYSTSDLIESAEHLFPEQIIKMLPKQCLADMKQAGKCIAFETPTAAAFHILRGVESVIRRYYAVVVGHAPKAKLRNWGAYIDNLDKAGADPKITSFLDHLREQYRNPILHPEEMLSIDDAVVLLGAAVSVIVQMMDAIIQHENKKTAGSGTS